MAATALEFTVMFSLQNMKMVSVPTKAFGNFFEGDCYIVLNVGTKQSVHWDSTGSVQILMLLIVTDIRFGRIKEQPSPLMSTTGSETPPPRMSRVLPPFTSPSWMSTWAGVRCSTGRFKAMSPHSSGAILKVA